jgi:ribokinase
MAVWNYGSINIDHVYRVPNLPAAGETLAARVYNCGLGGKGANQSVAAARAGARVHHIGAVSDQAGWVLDRLSAFGVDISCVARVEAEPGHAVIAVDASGENVIITHAGANALQSPPRIAAALARARAGDTLLLQNETPHQAQAARLARARGMRVMYSAAPFEAAALRQVLPEVSLLVVNAVEAEELQRFLGVGLAAMPVEAVVVTRGTEGVDWIAPKGESHFVPAFRVEAVDTAGAGDCFTGTLAAALDQDMAPPGALRLAAAAAAIAVTRVGTADAMPSRDEIEAFLLR